MGSAAANGSTPVTIWYRVTPNAYRSLRASTERFIRPVCSGAMYASVPAMISGGSGAWRSRGRREAMPKPVSHTCPAADIDDHVGWVDVFVNESTSVEPAKCGRQRHGEP